MRAHEDGEREGRSGSHGEATSTLEVDTHAERVPPDVCGAHENWRAGRTTIWNGSRARDCGNRWERLQSAASSSKTAVEHNISTPRTSTNDDMRIDATVKREREQTDRAQEAVKQALCLMGQGCEVETAVTQVTSSLDVQEAVIVRTQVMGALAQMAQPRGHY